ncbi:Metallo-dependent phosphatase, partial [Coemansia reversa NRRL 1564]
KLRILHFNDVYNVGASSRDPIGGASRFTSLVHSLQDVKDAAPTLTLFSGDAYFPSLESTISRGEHMLQVLNLLNIDASVLGNHEFDMGVEHLESLISRNNFPWILTNLIDNATGDCAAKGSLKYLIKEVDGVRVGIIGIIEKEWLDTLPCLPPTFEFHDFVTSARNTATMLKNPLDASMACDIVICLSHMRLGNDVKLIEGCGDVVDLVLSGHDHFYYIGSGIDSFEDPRPKNLGKRIINSGTDFRDLSEVILDLDKSSPGKTKISHVSVKRHRTTSNISESPEVKKIVDKMEASLTKALGYVIGHSSVDLDARASVCRIGESSLGSLAVDLMRLYYAQGVGAQIGMMCGGAIRSDRVYPAGEIRMRDIMEIFPFDDPVVVVEMTGRQILCALENGVSKWPEHDGRFPQVSGIRFEFDPRKAPGDRVMSDYGDEEDELLDINAYYVVAIRDYMYQGYDGYKVMSNSKAIVDKDSGILISSLFKRYFDGLAACNAGR